MARCNSDTTRSPPCVCHTPRRSGSAPVRLGIIGLGLRTEVLLVSLFAIEGVEIVGVGVRVGAGRRVG